MLITDPVDIPIDPVTGDMVVTNGRIVLTSGIPAVMQGARIRMQVVAGELFTDLDAGVPYFERSGVPASKAIFGQKFSNPKAVRAFRQQLLATPGVSDVPSLNVAFVGATRAMTVNWIARTAFGDTPADSLALGT